MMNDSVIVLPDEQLLYALRTDRNSPLEEALARILERLPRPCDHQFMAHCLPGTDLAIKVCAK